LDFLRASNENKVTFHFKDANSAGELRPAVTGEGSYTYRYVVMPMRI
jgi:DNA polymerase-3 subunit beta